MNIIIQMTGTKVIRRIISRPLTINKLYLCSSTQWYFRACKPIGFEKLRVGLITFDIENFVYMIITNFGDNVF